MGNMFGRGFESRQLHHRQGEVKGRSWKGDLRFSFFFKGNWSFQWYPSLHNRVK